MAAAKVPAVRREFSAGGIVIRRLRGDWAFAAIRPAGKPQGVWVLPKGQIAAGETGEAAAIREISEETGVRGEVVTKLGDTRYWFTWEGDRVFKIVSFFLVRYRGGRLGEIPEEFRHEVAEVRWLSLASAPRVLAYGGERTMAGRAITIVEIGQDV